LAESKLEAEAKPPRSGQRGEFVSAKFGSCKKKTGVPMGGVVGGLLFGETKIIAMAPLLFGYCFESKRTMNLLDFDDLPISL
jgi:hypothetical protein